MPFKRVYFFSLLFISASFFSKLTAQPRYSLDIQTSPSNSGLLNKLQLPAGYSDSAAVLKEIDRVISVSRNSGYLLAELARIEWAGKHAKAFISLGNQYSFLQLSRGNVPSQFWNKAGFSTGSLKIQHSNTLKIDEVFARLLKVYDNNGYPFASITMDSLQIGANAIHAALVVSPGALTIWDTLQIAGDVKVSRSFLESYLDLEVGTVYNETLLQGIELRINHLPFLRSVKKPVVKFTGNKARLTLFLQKQNSNQFDGILGLLPDNASGKMQLTGDLKLHVNNAFKQGETFDFNFKGLPGGSKELDLGLGLAELFSSPIGVDASFNLYRQDTSFQNVNSKFALKYRLPKGHFSIFISSRSGLPISADTLLTTVPEVAQIKYVSYGTGYLASSLNSITYPTRGGRLQLSAEAGRKKISEIPPSLSELLPDKVAQYRLVSNAEFYLSLSERAVLKISNQIGLLIGKNLFENELYRIGGFNTLRGFNEQSLLASNYSILNTEYRFLIEQSSYLFAFFNQGLLESRTVSSNRSDSPFGFGTGISLQLKTGIFSLSYALGKAKDNPLNLQGGKIHFGLVTLF